MLGSSLKNQRRIFFENSIKSPLPTSNLIRVVQYESTDMKTYVYDPYKHH